MEILIIFFVWITSNIALWWENTKSIWSFGNSLRLAFDPLKCIMIWFYRSIYLKNASVHTLKKEGVFLKCWVQCFITSHEVRLIVFRSSITVFYCLLRSKEGCFEVLHNNCGIFCYLFWGYIVRCLKIVTLSW